LVFGRTGFVGSFVFTTPKVSVGRATGAMVRLDDPLVSLKHAELQMDGGLFRIKDLGSRTGTRVNGAPVLPRQPLEPTDEISIGPFRLRVTTCEPDTAESGPDDGTSRLASMVNRVTAPPTEQAFFPPSAHEGEGRDDKGQRRRGQVEPRWPEEDLEDAPTSGYKREELDDDLRHPSSSAEPDSLGDMEATAVIRSPAPSTRPPPAVEKERPAPVAAGSPPLAKASGGRSASAKAAPAKKAATPAPSFDNVSDVDEEMVPMAFGSPEILGPSPRRVEDEDDDEDDDSDFVPPFDLLEALSRGGVDDHPSARGSALSLEVIHYRADRVISVVHPKTKGSLRRTGSKELLGALEQDGTFSVYPDACPKLSVRQGGRTLSTADMLASKDGPRQRLAPGMQAEIDLGDDEGYLIQWVPRAAAVPVPPLSIKPSRGSVTEGGLSIAVHVAVALIIAFGVLGDKDAESDINAGRFATINTKELELEPPPPPPPPAADAPTANVPPLPDAPTLTKHDPKTKVPPPVKGAPVTPQSQQETAQAAQSTATTNKLLSALGGAPSTSSPIAVTNLDAIPTAVGGFKVSGTVGKAPGDSLRVAAAGAHGGDVDTKSVNEVGGPNIGRVQGQTSSGVVRARVTSAPPASRGEGHLDRGEIQKVVNAHLYQVQGCYERQLAKDPSLGGKISYEWDVGLTGGVSNVRVGRSTVHNVEVTTCIQSAIQGWKFPTPQGGTVTVTYPFAFSALGG
jgi:hypothetical protein